MFFLPYRLDANRNGVPFLTLLICLVCIFVYWQQYSADKAYFDSIERFCRFDLSQREIAWLNRVPSQVTGNSCAAVLETIRASDDASAEIERLARIAKPIKLYESKRENLRHAERELGSIYQKFERDVPRHLTSQLAYDPKNWDILRMVTSTFSHGSASHLAGNLLFFYIFAASIEIVFGGFVFLLFIALTTLGTSVAYSLAMAGVDGALPTVGLSGVVMAAVAALGVMLPSIRIRCFLWFFVIFRILRIPALLLAVWYVGWDIYELSLDDQTSYINYVAHVSGAAIGALFGAYYLLFKSKLLKEITP